MDSQKRENFSYALWGEPMYDENKYLMKMNPKYGKGEMIGFYFDMGIHASLATYSLGIKEEKEVTQYKKDLFHIGKILKGRYFVQNSKKESFLFQQGDIFCFSGNYVLNTKYYFPEETKMLSVFGYQEDILASFDKKKWNTEKIEHVFQNMDLKKGILLSQDIFLEEFFQDLSFAMENNKGFMSYVKTMDLFYYFMSNYDKKKYTKSKSYTEIQVETVHAIKDFLEKNLDTYYSMPKLAKMFHISLSRMQSIFEAYYGVSPYRYHLKVRLEKANDLVLNTDIKIKMIAKHLGFTSYNKFVKAYKDKYVSTPSKDREAAQEKKRIFSSSEPRYPSQR